MRRVTVIAGIALICAAALPVAAQVMPKGTRITADPGPPPGAPTASAAQKVRIDMAAPTPVPAQTAPDESAPLPPVPKVLPPAATQPGEDPVVLSARIGEHPDRTRFVVEMSGPVKLRVFTLSNPNRVVVDMPEVLWRIQGGPQRPSGTGSIASYRYGQFRPGDSRIVIDLNTPVNVAQPMILQPSGQYDYRMVIDLFPTTQAAFDKTAGWPEDLSAPAAAAPVAVAPPPPASRPKIVTIDPGHGGIDSGTIGVDGTKEKDVVLDVGKRLAKELKSRGYTVYMTRDSDVFIPLGDRVAFSRAHHSDLFISLHANSNPDPGVSGLAVYTLSERGSDKEATLLANKENQSDIIAGVNLGDETSTVKNILIDLAQRDTMNKSSRFAMQTLKELSQSTDILPRDPHRSAAFVVLKAPDVPAELVELGFLSNPRDCAEMHLDSWKNGVAGAIADAVDDHFGVQPAVAAQVPVPAPPPAE